MEVFLAVTLAAALAAIVVLALAPARIFRPIAIVLAAGAAGFLLWAVSVIQTCVSESCIAVIGPGLLCATCVAALVLGMLARRVLGAIRSTSGQGPD